MNILKGQSYLGFSGKSKCFVLALILLFPNIGFAQVNLQNGLVGYYNFDSNVDDQSGNGNNCTKVSGVTYGVDRFGKAGKALSLDGGAIGGIESIRTFGFSNAFSISVWLKMKPRNSKYQQYTIATEDNPNTGPWSYSIIDDSTGNFKYSFGYANNLSFWTNSLDFFEAKRYNVWINYVAVLGDGQMKIYVDGVLRASKTISGVNMGNYNQTVTFGYDRFRSNSNVENVFFGSIDDFYAFNRVLSDAEIDSLYNNRLKSGLSLKEDLLAYYPFNGDKYDYSGNNNHLISVSGTQFVDSRYGISNSAIKFSGGNDRLGAADSPSLNSVGNGMSISMWINQTSANCFGCADQIPNYGYVLINKSPSGSFDGGYRLDARGANGSPNVTGRRARLIVGNGTSTGIDTEDDTDYSLNQWHHLAVTYDLDTVKYYLDNVLNASIKAPLSTITGNDLPLHIGGGGDDFSGIGFNYKGLMDEVRIYGRVLDASEINNLYNAYEIQLPSFNCEPVTVSGVSNFGFYSINRLSKKLCYLDTLGNVYEIGNTNLPGELEKYHGMDFDSKGNLYLLGDNDSLYTINTNTGNATFVSRLNQPEEPLIYGPAISFSPSDVLYVLDEEASTPEGTLRKVLDLSTGLSTAVGNNTTGSLSILAIEFDNKGNLWALDQCCSSRLLKISTATGVVDYYSPLQNNIIFASDMDFSYNNVMYALSIDDEVMSNVTTISRVDTTTGASRTLYTLSGIYFGLASYPTDKRDTVYINRILTVTSFKTITVTSFVTVFDCSTLTGIGNGRYDGSSITVFPNPGTSKISVVSYGNFVINVEVIDIKGDPIFSTNYPNSIDVSSWPNGAYLLNAKDENGIILKSFKILKE